MFLLTYRQTHILLPKFCGQLSFTCKIAVEERTGVCKSPFTEAIGGMHEGGIVAAVLVDVKDREL